MKNMKKLASLLLAMVIMLAMMPATFAEDNGSVTINKIILDDEGNMTNVYEIYKMLDLESFVDTDEGEAYSYKVSPEWAGFFATDEAKAYISVDSQGYVTWVNANDDRATAGVFAKLALAYAEANNIQPLKSTLDEDSYTIGDTTDTEGNPIKFIKFENLPMGYYLVDSTMGALCGLTTTNPNAVINAKNKAPTINKQVQEDSNSHWSDENHADIGQDVNFRTTIYVHAGAQDFVLHDTMSAGLTFKEVTKVEHVTAAETHTAPAEKYEVVSTGLTDGCTFEVRFSEEFCNEMNDGDQVVVHYTATLNENAVIGSEGNDNKAQLEFGEDHFTSEDSTKTTTYAFDLAKTNAQYKLLDGAEFRIYTAKTGGEEVKVKAVKDAEGNITGYVRDAASDGATDDEGNPIPGEVIVVKDGLVRISGFDSGKYYLEEVKTPAGYNQLSERQEFTISDANKNAIITGGTVSTDSGVVVVNKTGTMLPETGGIGTTLFYVVGGILVAAVVVVLVTRKRMSEK